MRRRRRRVAVVSQTVERVLLRPGKGAVPGLDGDLTPVGGGVGLVETTVGGPTKLGDYQRAAPPPLGTLRTWWLRGAAPT